MTVFLFPCDWNIHRDVDTHLSKRRIEVGALEREPYAWRRMSVGENEKWEGVSAMDQSDGLLCSAFWWENRMPQLCRLELKVRTPTTTRRGSGQGGFGSLKSIFISWVSKWVDLESSGSYFQTHGLGIICKIFRQNFLAHEVKWYSENIYWVYYSSVFRAALFWFKTNVD